MSGVQGYFDLSSGAADAYASDIPIERQIADVLRIRTNTIAGRPNVGNLALEFIHKGRALPASVLRDYLLRTLRSFIPNVTFDVSVDSELDGGSFQHFVVQYATV